MTAAKPHPKDPNPLLTMMDWEVVADHWPARKDREHMDDYMDRCTTRLAMYQTNLEKYAYLRVVFAPPVGSQSRASPSYRMPSSMGGGATGTAWVFSDASEVDDLIEVSSRFGKEAQVEGLRFSKQAVVLALDAASRDRGYTVRADAVVLLEVTNLGSAKAEDVLSSALASPWMKRHYPDAAKSTHLLSERAGARTLYVSLRLSVTDACHLLRDVQYDCRSPSDPQWAFSSTDGSGAAAASKKALNGKASPSTDAQWKTFLESCQAQKPPLIAPSVRTLGRKGCRLLEATRDQT